MSSIESPATVSFARRLDIPGRIRFDVPEIRGQRVLAAAIEAALAVLGQVNEVTANPTSGTVLIDFDAPADPAIFEQAMRAQIDGFAAADHLPSPFDRRRRLARVLAVAVPDRRTLAAPAALTVGAHGLNMLQNLSLIANVTVASGGASRILRRLGIVGTKPQLRVLTMTSLALTVGEVWTQHRRGNAWRRTSLRAEYNLRTAAFTQLQAQDLAFFDEHGTGPLLNVLTDQVASIGALVAGVDGLVEAAFMVVIASVALVRTSPRLALTAAAALPIAVVPARILSDRTEHAYSKVAEPSARLTQGLENILTGVVEVKSFTAERRETDRVDRLSTEVAGSLQTANSAALLQTSVVRNVLYVAAATIFWQAARQVVARKVPIPKLTRAVYWVPQLMGAIGAAAASAATYYGAVAAAERITTVLDSSPKIRSGPLRLPRGDLRGDITVENLTFGYRPDRPVLRNVSFALPAGATLGIVGPTGSGKSTLLRLLLRFYEPDAGRILLDGHDIRDLNIADLRSAIALVAQEVYLFDDTMAANLTYGRPDANADAVADALEAAAATDVVDALPDGLAAELGERGHRLSGGQRQRLALARALLKDSPILALDEATSHLDYASEAAIKTSLRTAAARKTVILIAHRLSSVRDADNIIVLDGGAIREQGSHQSLINQRGLYNQLWELQS